MIGMGLRPGIAFLWCGLMLAPTAGAQTLNEAASELAAKIFQALKSPDTATFSLENRSSLSSGDVAAVRSRLEASNLKLAATPDAADVRVTLSENFRGYVWVAETGQGAERQVAVVAWPRPETPGEGPHRPRLTLTSQRVWEQEAPILDWTALNNGSGLLILETERLRLLHRDGGKWIPTTAVAVPAVRARDPRGRIALVAGRGGFTVYLPGGVCTGLANGTLTLDCHSTPGPWPLEAGGRQLAEATYAQGRDFFDGKMTVGTSEQVLAPFYSFAALPQASSPVWLFAGVDGEVRVYTPRLETVGTVSDWGSDVTSVATDCGDGWQVLATAPGDQTEPDTVRAYQFVDHNAVAVSAPLALPGAVTALWPAADGKAAHAVAYDMKTDRYAALRLDIACAQ